MLGLDIMLYIALGYLMGSIPFGLLLTKAAGVGDIRRMGSGSIGATNVLRSGNKKLALATLLLDGGKGLLAAALPNAFADADSATTCAALAGLASVVGHVFPLWLSFRGGKGVATAFGALLALDWIAGLAGIAIWMAVAATFRYSSFAGLVSLATSPLLLFLSATIWHKNNYAAAMAFGLVFVLVAARHSANIRRLANGTEPKIGHKSDDASAAAPPS